VNYIHIDNYRKLNDIIDEAYDSFGDKIAIVHAKDFVIHNNTIVQVPLGTGLMDYDKLFARIEEEEREIDIIIEELTDKDLIEGIAFLRAKANYRK